MFVAVVNGLIMTKVESVLVFTVLVMLMSYVMFCVTWLSLDERTNESVRNLQFQVAQLVFIPGDDLNKHLKTVPRSTLSPFKTFDMLPR